MSGAGRAGRGQSLAHGFPGEQIPGDAETQGELRAEAAVGQLEGAPRLEVAGQDQRGSEREVARLPLGKLTGLPGSLQTGTGRKPTMPPVAGAPPGPVKAEASF